jgi:hypothetical protein
LLLLQKSNQKLFDITFMQVVNFHNVVKKRMNEWVSVWVSEKLVSKKRTHFCVSSPNF